MKEVYGKSHSVAVLRFTFLIGFLLCAAFALGQGSLVEGVTSITGTGNVMKVIPNAPIVVCSYPGTGGVPCTNLAQTYTTPTEGGTCPSNAQVITPTTANCSATSDAAGNFAFIVDSTASTNIVYYFKYQNTWNGPFARTNGGGGGNGSPGGSNGQLQFNNTGAFGAISNAAIGSTLASKGTSTTPAFQSKMLIDVRDYGAIPDGSTDNATAIAAAFTAANAVSAGSPTVYFGCNGAGATCKYNYSGSGTSAINPTVPMTIACAPNTFLNYTGTTHAVDIGPSGLATADSHLYTIKDCGFTGGASYTEGIFINNFIVQVHFLNNYFLDFGNRVGATINCTGNCWDILLQSNFWFNDDNSNRNVLDAHLGTNAFVFATGNHMFCLKVTGAACDVTNPAYGIWARDAFLTGNQLGPGPQPVVRISSEGNGGGAGMYLTNNIIEGNTGSTTAAVEYGNPGATGNVHLANLHLVSNSIFWPSAINVDIMVTPQTPASSSYFLDASLITGNAITNSPTGTGKYFNFNLGSLNQFYGNYCGSTTVLCDQATANITETNGAKVNTWVIPYRQSNQSAGPQANYPIAMDASGPHYLSTASFHGLGLPLQCSDSSGSGTAQTCNTNPKFDSTGTNLAPVAGDCIIYRTTTTNTGALTLNVNGTSAVAVQKRQGTVALAAGDLVAGHNTSLCYDGTNWSLLDPITNALTAWSGITNPIGNLALSMGTNATAFTFGDFGASPSSGIFSLTDTATTTTDTSVNLLVNTGGSSRHNPFVAQSQGINQFQVCWQPGPQGETVIGSAVTCPTISQSPFAKLVVMSSTAAHSVSRLYQKNAAATGTMLEMNNATASSAAYNFFTACSGASATDTSCGGGSIIASLRGDGLFTAASLAATNMTGGPFCVHETAGVLTAAAADCGTGGGTPGGATLSFQYNNAGAFGGITPPATVGVFIPEYINPTAATTTPIVAQVADCPAPTTITLGATTGIVAALDAVGCNIVHDRAATGAATLTIPTPTTLASPGPIFIYTNNSAQTDTLAPTTFTISKNGAPSAATASVNPKEVCKVSVDPLNASTWLADCHAGATLTDGLFGSSAFGKASACETSFGATTLSTIATTTDTGLNCLPINAVIDSVVYRITTTITTAASFTIGDATTAARFCSTQSTLTAGTTGICFVQADQTGAAGPRQTAAAKVRVTSNVNPGAGVIRLIVYYHTWTAPTS